jgi:hypothetical protein
MVQLKWNVSDEIGLDIIHRTLIDILKVQPKRYMALNDMVFLLNNRTRKYNIHSQKKHNCASKYINYKYGGIIKFLDMYALYGIRIKHNTEYVYLMVREGPVETAELLKEVKPWLTKDRDWVLV